MHSIVKERRKFGTLRFCISYEFNNSDLEASLGYNEKHLTSYTNLGTKHSWKTIKYMICEVQYGGRITDNLDRNQLIYTEISNCTRLCSLNNTNSFR